MVVVLLAMSLWLFGFFTFNLPSSAYAFAPRHDTYFGNYLWGILTAIFSTPCTGPLFPPILLWARGQSTLVGVPALMMVGVGMAFPYVLLSAFPQAARRFPRVGPWSELFKQMLGFMLLGFTVFFAAGRLTHSDMLWWSIVPVAVLAGAYLMARTVQLSREARAVGISSVLAVGMVTATVLVACRFSGVFDPRPAGPAGSASAAIAWVPYSDATLAAARQQGKIVLVKFTANWCFNCKLIEGNVYHDADALQVLRKYDVVTLKADLTEEHAPGEKRLLELEPSGGIPLTAIYVPGYDKPFQLSSVYTTSTLIETLDQLARIKTAMAR
jgi:thiol:disulfide interchange protein